MKTARSTKRAWAVLAAGGLLILLGVLGLILTERKPADSMASSAKTAKLLVPAAGWVQITPTDLHTLGWAAGDLATLRITRDGQTLPTWLSGDTLRFFAPISPTRYMSETVYWVERGDQPGAPVSEQPITPGDDLSLLEHYTATLRLEENHIYSPQVKDGDHWLWLQLIAPMTKTVMLTLDPALASGPARVQIEVWGNTEAPADPDHRYQVSLNGQDLGEATWDGAGYHTIDLAVPAGVLRVGENALTLQAPGLPDVTVDGTYLNAITLHYPRALAAQNDVLYFTTDGGRVRLTGFTGPIDLFDVTEADRITRTRLNETAAFASEAGHRYWAVGPRGYQAGQWQAAQLSPDLRAASNAADFVAIGPSDLLQPLQPLLDWHTTEGLKVMAIPVEAVYDQFGAGRVDPEALRSFLQWATQQWTVKPRYALIVGDASYDMLDYTTSPEANRVPTLLVQTQFGGETASDVGLAQLDDGQLDIALGRLPAREATQVETYVKKALAYAKQAPPGEWRTSLLAVADGQDPSFRADAQAFIDQLGGAFQAQLLNPSAGADQASTEIVNDWNKGSSLIAYFGHGSVTQWGKDNLFTVKDVAALQNGDKLPVVINMTCLAGLFTHPKVQSLTETLLWKPGGGAVAVLAPTSLTLAADQSFLSKALIDELLKDRTARLGDVFVQAQRTVSAAGPNTQDVLRTFLLFGDPALRLVQP